MAGAGRKVFTAGDVLTASQVQDYLQDQAVMVFAGTAARSSAIATPTEGMVAITTDTDELQYYNGSDWVAGVPFGAWQTYAPTYSNVTPGAGVTMAKFCQIGKTVHVKVIFTLGAGSAVSGRIGISLPVTAFNDNLDNTIAPCRLSAGGVTAQGFATLGTTTRLDLFAITASGTYTTSTLITNLIPGTWASGSIFGVQFTYEAA